MATAKKTSGLSLKKGTLDKLDAIAGERSRSDTVEALVNAAYRREVERRKDPRALRGRKPSRTYR